MLGVFGTSAVSLAEARAVLTRGIGESAAAIPAPAPSCSKRRRLIRFVTVESGVTSGVVPLFAGPARSEFLSSDLINLVFGSISQDYSSRAARVNAVSNSGSVLIADLAIVSCDADGAAATSTSAGDDHCAD